MTITAATRGLSSEEATRRLAADGPNVVPPPRATPAWRRLARQATHFFALLLWGAAVLAALAGMPQLGVAIAIVVCVNAAFAFAQEHRADRAAHELRSLLPVRATVERDGAPVVVDAADLVVGDLLLLEPGDRVSADAELVEARALAVDTSHLSGMAHR